MASKAFSKGDTLFEDSALVCWPAVPEVLGASGRDEHTLQLVEILEEIQSLVKPEEAGDEGEDGPAKVSVL